MRIVLLEPPISLHDPGYGISSPENLGLGYLASSLRVAGHDVAILSAQAESLDVNATIDAMLQFAPSLVGVSLPFTDALASTLPALSCIRSALPPGVPLAAGGHAATADPAAIIAGGAVDCVVLGEGEATILDIVAAVGSGTVLDVVPGLMVRRGSACAATPPRQQRSDLDLLPFPARDTTRLLRRLGRHSGEIYMIGSRGCPYRCSFCDIKTFYGGGGPGWRGRSPENILLEFELLVREFGTAPRYLFVDDQFFGPGKQGVARVLHFADLLAGADLGVTFEITCRADSVDGRVFERLKRAGLGGVYMGLDSGSQAQLNRYRKDTTVASNLRAVRILRELDIPLDFGFIMFDPLATMEDLEQNVVFLRQLAQMDVPIHPDVLTNTLRIYPGTPNAKEFKPDDDIKSPDARAVLQMLVAAAAPPAAGRPATELGLDLLAVAEAAICR